MNTATFLFFILAWVDLFLLIGLFQTWYHQHNSFADWFRKEILKK